VRILLVDDHADTLEVFSRVLRSRGYHVEGAETLADAKLLCQTGRFDLLISDIRLPDGDAWELAKLAQACGAKPIALTASAMPDEVARAKQAGFLRHLPKPIVFAELEKAIQEVTSNP
jgi:CheY-like chemotaxis protein